MLAEIDIDRSLRSKIRAFSNYSIPALTKVMAVVLILYGLLHIYLYLLDNDGSELSWTVIASAAILLICGYLILLDFSFSFGRMLGLYAIGLGGSRIFTYLNILIMAPEGTVVATVVFLFSLVLMIVALNLCYTGVVYLGGNTRGRIGMFASTSFMVIGIIVFMVIVAYLKNYSVLQILAARPKETVALVLYILLLFLLSSQQMRKLDKSEHYISVLNGIRRTESSPSSSYIYRSVAKDLCKAFEDRSSWKKIEDNGPVEAEYHFKLNNRNDDKSYVTVQKWKDRDPLYFTITSYEFGSVMEAYRFSSIKIVPEGDIDSCTRIHLYSEDSHVQINVRDDPYSTFWRLDTDV